MNKFPYQMQRITLPRSGCQPPQWRFDLLNTTTGRVIAYAFAHTPFPPKRLARRQAELNSKHAFEEIAI